MLLMGRCQKPEQEVKPSGFQRTLRTTGCLCFRYTRLIRKETHTFKICDFYFQFLGFALTKKKKFFPLATGRNKRLPETSVDFDLEGTGPQR